MEGLLTLQGQLFLLMALGVFFCRRGIVGEGFQTGLTELVIDLVLPCNIITSFQVALTREILMETSVILAVSLAIQIGCWVLAVTLFRRMPPDKRPPLQYGTICSNAGFLGTPVAEGIFGAQGILLAAVYLVPQRIAMWTLGVAFFVRGDRKSLWKKVCTHPCILAVLLGMVLLATQFQFPAVVQNTIQALSRCNTGLSMFLIGMIMADLRLRDFLDRDTLYFSVIRLGLIPLLVLLGCRAVGVDELATGIAVVLAAMPAGGTTAILAAKYDCNAEQAAGCVTVSTLLSMAAIPLWCMAL